VSVSASYEALRTLHDGVFPVRLTVAEILDKRLAEHHDNIRCKDSFCDFLMQVYYRLQTESFRSCELQLNEIWGRHISSTTSISSR
jgi:hypothetical protein